VLLREGREGPRDERLFVIPPAGTLAVLPREGREGPPLQERAASRGIFMWFRGPRALRGRPQERRSDTPVRYE
jgi:hypothetical protein